MNLEAIANTATDLETLEDVFGRAMREPGPWFSVAKIEEAPTLLWTNPSRRHP